MYLSLIAEVLDGINETDAGYEVKTIRDRLFSNDPEEHPAEVENADLKECLDDMSKQLEAAKVKIAELEKQVKNTQDQEVVRNTRTTIAQRFSRDTSAGEIRKISRLVCELRIADDGSRPLSWKNVRSKLNLKNDEFHRVIRPSAIYREEVIARIKSLRSREEGWEYRGKLSKLTGIDDITEEELA